MKYVAILFSFYILSLAVMPMARAAISQYSEGCSKSCSSNSAEKDADGCPKQMCSPFSCCLKTFVLIQDDYRCLEQPVPDNSIQNNFALKQILLSFKNFDIWNPPKFA